MKFYIKRVLLWLKDGEKPRELIFENNKVNVITGKSGTGKSSILAIIDYCLLGSKSRIVEEVINENTLWYGINFCINDKDFCIARKSLQSRMVSDEVFFSSTGEIPVMPFKSIDIKELKKILEVEFFVNENLTIPYGGKHLKAGSKISFRYFLLLNTLSEEIIASSNIFFDFNLYDQEKYREALDRIFYLIIGADDVDDVLINEKIEELEKKIIRSERRTKAIEKSKTVFENNILDFYNRAQQYDLVERKLVSAEDAFDILKGLVFSNGREIVATNQEELEELKRTRRNISRKLRSLRSFKKELERYRIIQEQDYDSLLPVKYLKENFSEIIPSPEVDAFISALNEELLIIKKKTNKKNVVQSSISDDIRSLETQLKEVEDKISLINDGNEDNEDIKSERNKFIFIGELKAHINLYESETIFRVEEENVNALIEDLEELKGKLKTKQEKKRIIIELLHERIRRVMDLSSSLGVYSNYKPYFDVREKVLKLRAPNSANPTSIGSRSNFMFLHLFLFLGLHEHMILEDVKFVPQFLILDQPSQPYFESAKEKGVTELENDDKMKLSDAFKLLDDFIKYVNIELKTDFQIILLEHATGEYWEEPNLETFKLVEDFRNGNALIPKK